MKKPRWPNTPGNLWHFPAHPHKLTTTLRPGSLLLFSVALSSPALSHLCLQSFSASLSLKCEGIITCGVVQEANSPAIIATDVEIQEQMSSNSYVAAWQNKNLYWGIKAINILQGCYLWACSWHLEWQLVGATLLSACCCNAATIKLWEQKAQEGECGGGRAEGVTTGNLVTRRPLSPMVTVVTKRPPPPVPRPPGSLPVTKAPVLVRGIGSFVAGFPSGWQGCDSSKFVLLEGKVLWAWKGEKPRLGAARTAVSGLAPAGWEQQHIPARDQWNVQQAQKNPVSDPYKWRVLLMGLSFGRCLLFLEVGGMLAAGDCILC